jgi:raffinose/stachyose/melibiose transport system permease protein
MREQNIYRLYLLPALLLNISIILIPGILTLLVSFTDWNGVSSEFNYIGLRNFIEMSNDWVFWQSLYDNIRWTLLFVTVPVAIGLWTAYLLLRKKKTKSIFQLVFLLPYVMAPITNAMLWNNIIFNPQAGLVGFLQRSGIEVFNPLANTSTALYGVAAVDIWHYWGFLTVIYFAAMRQTPYEHVEVAVLEGANGWQMFRFVYFPNIKPTVQMLFVMIIIFSFLTFDYIYLLTNGGPAHSTEMLSTYAYSFAFSSFQVGKAAAVGLVMSVFGLIASFFYVWMSRKEMGT